MRAVVVFPTPRTPVRIQACGMRPVSNAFETVRTIASCPIRSANVAGRYLRASTRYDAPPAVAPRSSPGLVASFILTWRPQPEESERRHLKSGRLTSDPSRSSLGLLPSGPDPVGEWLVHRQPPASYIGRTKQECKRPLPRRASFPLVWRFRSPHHSRGESALRTSEPKPHQNHRFSSVLRFRSSYPRVLHDETNFGIGTLALIFRLHLWPRAGRCTRNWTATPRASAICRCRADR